MKYLSRSERPSERTDDLLLLLLLHGAKTLMLIAPVAQIRPPHPITSCCQTKQNAICRGSLPSALLFLTITFVWIFFLTKTQRTVSSDCGCNVKLFVLRYPPHIKFPAALLCFLILNSLF